MRPFGGRTGKWFNDPGLTAAKMLSHIRLPDLLHHVM